MKNRLYRDHVKTFRDEDHNLFLSICDKGLNCPVCYEILDRVTKKDLQAYAEEKFESGNHYMFSVEWILPLSYLEKDPKVLDILENRIKNFLEKNYKMDALYRMDLHLDLSSISVFMIWISPSKMNLKVTMEEFWDWTSFGPIELYCNNGEWVDKYEFYVMAVPHPYNKEELDFISELNEDSKFKKKLENRVVIIEGD